MVHHHRTETTTMNRRLAALVAAPVAVLGLAACHSPVAIVDSRPTIDRIYAYDDDAGSGYVQIEFHCQAYYGGEMFGRLSPVGFKSTSDSGVIVTGYCPNWAPFIVNNGNLIEVHQWH
jgi:hypothetical protein